LQVFATVLYLSQQPGQVRLGLSVSPHGDVKELRELLASDTGIEEDHMLLTEIDQTGFHRTFSGENLTAVAPVYRSQR
jgi:ubiquitin carboxyl-terminal hydrolase 31